MSELIAASAAEPREVAERSEPAVSAQVVITEQEVAFATAVALHSGSARPPDDVPPRHYPPRRSSFLEHAAMRREMYRL